MRKEAEGPDSAQSARATAYITGLNWPKKLTAWIDGDWAVDNDSETHMVEDPGTAMPIGVQALSRARTIDRAVECAVHAASKWKDVSPERRGQALHAVSEAIRSRSEELAALESIDTGKPFSQAVSDVELSARYFKYYAGYADKVQGETVRNTQDSLAYTVREPLGVVAHIIPWNSPLSQLTRGVAPSLAAGNAVVVKPSELAPMSSLLFASLASDAGLPDGLCNVVCGDGDTGAALAQHPDVSHITFTGSVETGRLVHGYAALRTVECTLELGGKSAAVVRRDANLDRAVSAGVGALVRNSGQSCVAATRFIVQRSRHEEFLERLCARAVGLDIGYGLDDPDLGPLISSGQLQRVHGYLDSARSDGATFVCDGERFENDSGGHFMGPTVLSDVDTGMSVAREEVFGPVLCVFGYEDDDEAIKIANDTHYGLGAAVFTEDVGAALRFTQRLEAGSVSVNRYPASGVEIPFGGYKDSGLGRERGWEGIAHYTQLKSVVIALD